VGPSLARGHGVEKVIKATLVATHTSLPRRLPGLDARHATPRARLVRRAVALVAVLGAFLLLAAVLAVTFVGLSSGQGATAGRHDGGRAHHAASTGTSTGRVRTTPPTGATAAGTTPSATSPTATETPTPSTTTAPWRLPAPVDAEVVLPGSGGTLEVLGGATSGGKPANGVFTLDTATGALAHVGDMRSAVSGAAGAVIAGRALVLGGGTPAPTAVVQGVALPGSAPSAAVPTDGVVGSLPAPRTGAAAVTVGTVTYVVGGADGATPDPDVLATSDGRTFTVVATLRDPVSFPAVAAVGNELYVFGGQTQAGASPATAVDDIQVVDPALHTVSEAGHLSVALSGASAVSLGGQVFVIGGDTTSATGTATPGSGTARSTSGTVWAFDPSTGTVRSAGHLTVPVSLAGVAVVGQTAWVVGGESDGAPVTDVQSLTYP